MPQFVHAGPVPVVVDSVDADPEVHPDHQVFPGQVITADENPDPAVFHDAIVDQPEPEPDVDLSTLPAPAAKKPGAKK